MSYRYMYKQEQAIVFKLGRFFDIAPYYVWQETRTAQGEDQSNLIYLDVTAKTPLLSGGFTVNDRLRYQYDLDKEKTIWRNSLRLARPFRLSQWQIAPFIEDEVFYDTQSGQINRNWASIGIGMVPCRWGNISLAYLLDSRKQNDNWTEANVLVSSMSIRF